MPGGEVVATVQHDVGAGHQFVQHGALGALFQRDHFDAGVVFAQRAAPRGRFRQTDAVGTMQDLALQIGQVDRVAVGQRDASDPGGGKIQGGRRTQAAGADHDRVAGKQAFLPLDAYLRQEDVARVAQQLFVVHGHQPVRAARPLAIKRGRAAPFPGLRAPSTS